MIGERFVVWKGPVRACEEARCRRAAVWLDRRWDALWCGEHAVEDAEQPMRVECGTCGAVCQPWRVYLGVCLDCRMTMPLLWTDEEWRAVARWWDDPLWLPDDGASKDGL